MRKTRRKHGASTALIAVILIGSVAAGFHIVGLTTREVSDGLPGAKAAAAQTLRYAPPEGCRGARVIQTLPPQGFLSVFVSGENVDWRDLKNRVVLYGEENWGNGWHYVPAPSLFEQAHNADFDGDGDSTGIASNFVGHLPLDDEDTREGFMFLRYPYSSEPGGLAGEWDDGFNPASRDPDSIDPTSIWMDVYGRSVRSNYVIVEEQNYYIRASESEIQIATHQGRGCWTAYWCHPNDDRGFRDPGCTTTENQSLTYALPTWCRGAASSIIMTSTGAGTENNQVFFGVDGLSESEYNADFDGDGTTNSDITSLVGTDMSQAESNRRSNVDPGLAYVLMPHGFRGDALGSWDDAFLGTRAREMYLLRALESEIRIGVDRDAGCWTVFWCHPDTTGAVGHRDTGCG